jgi:hypothetical protein
VRHNNQARALEQVIGITVALDELWSNREDESGTAASFRRHKSLKAGSRETLRSGKKVMRFWVLALSLLGFLVSADAASAGLSTTTRDPSVASASAAFTDAATQETEDQIGLNKGRRRDVQRRLTRLGFDTRINGRFDENTRAVITRWQTARGYPATGFLNTPQHQSLLTESVSAANASIGDESDNDNPRPRRGDGVHRHRIGGPVGLIGGMVGGLFGRR